MNSLSATRPSKLRSVCIQLHELAHRSGPGTKLPTVSAMCRDMSASVSTMSLALGELEAQGVLERRHGVGIYVSERLQKTICFLCDPRFFREAGHSPFWDLLVEHARRRAAEHFENFEFHFVRPDDDTPAALQDALREAIAHNRVHGVLAVGLAVALSEWISAQGVPVVAYAGYAAYTVDFDTTRGMAAAARALVARGCRTIEFWTMRSAHENVANRPQVRAIRKVLRDAKLAVSPCLVRVPSLENESAIQTRQEQGFRLAVDVFAEDTTPDPDGILIDNDLMAQGVLLGLEHLGLRVGRDVQIATHANKGSPVLLGFDNRITLIEFDPAAISEAMFSLLETAMTNHAPKQPHVLIQATLQAPQPF